MNLVKFENEVGDIQEQLELAGVTRQYLPLSLIYYILLFSSSPLLFSFLFYLSFIIFSHLYTNISSTFILLFTLFILSLFILSLFSFLYYLFQQSKQSNFFNNITINNVILIFKFLFYIINFYNINMGGVFNFIHFLYRGTKKENNVLFFFNIICIMYMIIIIIFINITKIIIEI